MSTPVESLLEQAARRGLTPKLSERLVALETKNPGALQAAGLAVQAGRPVSRPETRQCRTVDDTAKERWDIHAGDILRPRSVEEVVEIVRAAAQDGVPLRFVGSARSLSDAPIPPADGVMVSTCKLGDTLRVDEETLRPGVDPAGYYRCGAGQTVKQLLATLDADAPPRTVTNTGSGNFQTVLGAVATATHGSGINRPAFPGLVASIQVVTFDAAGEVVVQEIERSVGDGAIHDAAAFAAAQRGHRIEVQLVQDTDTFQAALVSMGLFAAVTAATLIVVPQYMLQEQRTVGWWSEVTANLTQSLADNDHYELLINPLGKNNDDGVPDHQCLITTRNWIETQDPVDGRPATMALATTPLGRLSTALTVDAAIRQPLALVPFMLHTSTTSTEVTNNINVNHDVLMLNLDINSASTEQHVPVEHTVAAVEACIAVVESNWAEMQSRLEGILAPAETHLDLLLDTWKSHPVSTSTIAARFVPATPGWLAMEWGRPTCAIETPMPGADHLDERLKDDPTTWGDEVKIYAAYAAGRTALFQTYERILIDRFGARPHWGQANFIDGEQAAALYPEYARWAAAYRQGNAAGVFNSPLTDRLGISVHPSAEREPRRLASTERPIEGQVIFRPRRGKKPSILKIKGELGWALYDGLIEPVSEPRCIGGSEKCKRMGVNFIGSTQNVKDPVVCEMRFSPAGELLADTDDYQLYHSLASNRHDGTGSFDGNALTISGEAGVALEAFLSEARGAENPGQGTVALRATDFGRGAWSIGR